MTKRKSQAKRQAELAAVASNCACLNFRKVSRAVTKMFDDALVPAGIRSTQLVILVAIAAEDGITTPRLARSLELDSSTLVRALRPLERDGLIERSRADGNRRITIFVTEAGQEALDLALPYWQAAQKRFVDQLGVASWDDLRDTLGKAIASCQD